MSSAPFVTATSAVDEAEHSLEARSSPAHATGSAPLTLHALQMHLPYLVKCFAGQPFKLVPIIVGALTPAAEEVCPVSHGVAMTLLTAADAGLRPCAGRVY